LDQRNPWGLVDRFQTQVNSLEHVKLMPRALWYPLIPIQILTIKSPHRNCVSRTRALQSTILPNNVERNMVWIKTTALSLPARRYFLLGDIHWRLGKSTPKLCEIHKLTEKKDRGRASFLYMSLPTHIP